MTLIWSLSPALLLIYPEFDELYPLITLVLLVSCQRALGGSLPWALVFGLGWFAATLMAFHLLALVPFFAIYAGLNIRQARRSQMPIARRAVWSLLFGIIIFIGLHLFLYLISGYNTIATFFHAWEVQKTLERSRPQTLLTPWINLYDFALGLGYVPLVLFAIAAVRGWVPRNEPNAADLLTGASVLTILIVTFSGRLDYETARVWLFLQPLVIAPTALLLTRWTRAERFWVLTTLTVLTATIGRQLWFL
jgi:hypothetical protein